MKRTMPPSLPRGPQHYWQQMIELSRKGGFTIPDVYGHSNTRYSTVKNYVVFCADQGFIEKIGERPALAGNVAFVYRVRDPRLAAPIERRADFANDRGRRAQQLWTAMRVMRSFTVQDIIIAASTDTIQVPEQTARDFIRRLTRAGYVVEIGQRARRGLCGYWKLLPARNTGPLAPAFLEKGEVCFDRNTGKVVNLNAPVTAWRAA